MYILMFILYFPTCYCTKNAKYYIVPVEGLILKPKEQKTTKADPCKKVCDDLPRNDKQPVCMMLSRYKRSYQYFVNECHARRTICADKLVLHMVHPSRCFKSKQAFMNIT